MEKREFEIDEFTRKIYLLEFIEVGVDLRSCVKGDRLITRDGLELIYVQPLVDFYYDHEVQYTGINKIKGSRTHAGKMLRTSDSDSDIVEIIRK